MKSQSHVQFVMMAEQGDADAQYYLGTIYYHGKKGIAQDREKGVAWYRKAAEQGNSCAQYWLGYAYYHGEGIARDSEVGMTWLCKAAKQGNTYAMDLLDFS